MTDRRLIEDYLPIRDISAEASREKSIRHGNISTLHLWWARRPLVAARAAVFGALVPAPDTPEEREELEQEVIDLCKWQVSAETIAKARQRILAANGGEPPKVLDMFAGGGSIPLEACQERGAKSANHRNKKGSPAYSVLGSNGNHTKMQ